MIEDEKTLKKLALVAAEAAEKWPRGYDCGQHRSPQGDP